MKKRTVTDESSDNNKTVLSSSKSFWHENKNVLTFLGLLILTCLGLLIRSIRHLYQSQQHVTKNEDQQKSLEALHTRASPMPTTDQSSSQGGTLTNPEISRPSLPGPGIFSAGNQNDEQYRGIAFLLHAIKRFLRVERPFPVAVRGISLYALWDADHAPSDVPATFSQGIWVGSEYVGPWPTLLLVWQPAHDGEETPVMTAREAGDAVTALFSRLNELSSSQVDGKVSIPSTYLILHIEELRTSRPLLYLFYRKKAKADIKQSTIDAQEDFVEGMQRLCGLDSLHTSNAWRPNTFSHYDREGSRRGWLIISPTLALVAGLDNSQARILANLIQPRDTDISYGPGIISERYQEFLGRVAQWNGTQDIYEAVNHLETLVESSQKSTDGQVLLNLALATIGILIAYFTSQTFHNVPITSLSLLIVASVMFWFYARSGRLIYQLLGWLGFLVAIIFAFAWSWVERLFDALIRFHF